MTPNLLYFILLAGKKSIMKVSYCIIADSCVVDFRHIDELKGEMHTLKCDLNTVQKNSEAHLSGMEVTKAKYRTMLVDIFMFSFGTLEAG